ncbi:sugar kinase [Subtercola sp. PAMC28395]|uniref:FGGY-family carbohydrate kinase n=1 Tax=Subtercola sp. PAMC28395 TaxID=2846775 RepID=UPI001C0A9ACD|nr:FGGY family carbohydrate kinase [Subtercola sp. PAMC28395]QWT24169.1 sugar kinase [Subtercola sp. PAMC28395]
MALLIGFDLGTFEAKGVLVNETGEVRASSVRSYSIITPKPGFVEHDAELHWWGSFCEIVGELLSSVAEGESVAAVACSGIGPSVLPVDASGHPLRNAILYGIDTRATLQIARIEDALGREVIHARSGNDLSSQSAGPKIAWIHDNESEVYSRTHRFVTSQSFLVGRLTDRWVMDYGTAAYFHPLYELAEGRWNTAGCEWFVDDDQLPELAWAGEVAGAVSRAAAGATGLAEGTPVLVGTSDALAEAFSCGALDPGDLMVMYGSSHFFIQVVDRAVTNAGLYAAPYLFEGSYVLAAGTSTAGTITRWFVDILGLEQNTDGAVFTELAIEAGQSPPGANELLALPHFSGERTPLNDPDARGMLAGLTVRHTRADVYRSLLEGIGYGVADVFACYADAGVPPHRILAVGGGTKNSVWLSLVSDMSGLAQEVCHGNGASYGDAMLAAVAVGLVPSPRAVAAWAKTSARIIPDAARTRFYSERTLLWHELQTAMQPIAHQLARLSSKGN